MFTAEIRFAVSSDAEIESVESLIAAWSKNGQVLEWQSASTSKGYLILALLPKPDALCANNNNIYATRDLEAIANLGIEPPNVAILGADTNSAEPCYCAERPSLVLFTHFLTKESPVRCGHCFGPVPLYELPHVDDHEHLDVLQWAADYCALDTLQMHCTTGERFSEGQLWRYDSSLSKQGRRIADKLTELTNIPVYYYLLKSRGISLTEELRRVCPGCGGAWAVRNRWHELFDFKCDSCLLISTVAFNLTR